ncbi:esterase-like activity of phytase family protein [Nocardioides sp. SYSU D00038]|uniref:esterase-like activity of phytase family protein n=1 Tax=Nocardioides sp. SYSU D00038 TaxID=2812554 RepID=UPI00196796D3|nr:esterase-like activity of phytase family protein [Nocardioides sp. SYSU D00038]
MSLQGLGRGLAIAAVGALPLGLLVPTLPPATAAPAAGWFERVATYPVHLNVPAGVDPLDETVAEISAVTEDGRTVVYTDAAGKRIGFLDITDPAAPVGDGTLDLAQLGDADDQPTSVAVVGDHVLVVVDTTGGDFEHPSGRLDVVEVASRQRVASVDLGGQPDSIAISPGGDYAAIAMENQRDEDATPPGGDEGDLPQLPAGFVQVVELAGAPTTWTADPVALVEDDGDPLPALADLDTPEDPEPEYVDINDDDELVVTLQENNGLVVVDLPTRAITGAFSAGTARVGGVDTDNDGVFDFTDTIDVPREPDAVQWVGDGLVATANEGDWKGGSRGWTVFDTSDGSVVWDSGNTLEYLAVEHGLFNDDRADNKGTEPEGLAFATIDQTPYAFVGSERSNFVAVYDMSDPADPEFRQVLPTTNGPEGLLPVPARDLLVVSSETDDADAGVRASVGVYALGTARPAFPSVRSEPRRGSYVPIGWGALGALSGVPGDPTRMWAASDAAYATGRIYSLDVSRTPAVIDRVLEVREPGGAKPEIDVEGLFARPQGGFWLAVEGATGPGNALVRTDALGVVQQTVPLPAAVTDHVRSWGLEGVAARGTGSAEQVYVALQRPLWVDPGVPAGALQPLEGNVARIGRYDVATGAWTWFAYPLSPTSVAGDWVGLSEITVVDDDTLAVIERDKLNGPRAALKRVYTVDLPTGSPSSLTPVTKRLAVDLLPAMRAGRGWTQEKLEGLGISSGGQVFAVTDNDGVVDATGETQLYRLGDLKQVFAAATGTSTRLTRNKATIRKGKQVRLSVTLTPSFTTGTVRILDGAKVVRTVRLAGGRASVSLRLTRVGKHRLRAVYVGDADSRPSTSAAVTVKVTKKKRR